MDEPEFVKAVRGHILRNAMRSISKGSAEDVRRAVAAVATSKIDELMTNGALRRACLPQQAISIELDRSWPEDMKITVLVEDIFFGSMDVKVI